MTKQAPYAADTRAKGWRFELDYERITQSDTWDLAAEVPMAQPALLMMWMMAWQQVPCGSLPNDESVIRAKCRIPGELWPSMRDLMMRGWWLADDGRLYHDTIVERVHEMVQSRNRNASRVASHRAHKREQHSCNALLPSVVTTPEPEPVPEEIQQPPRTSGGVASKSPRPSRKAPASFEVDAELRSWAAKECQGVNVEAETAKFLDHTFSAARTDWRGAWRNWMRRARDSIPSRSLPGARESPWVQDNRNRVAEFAGQAAMRRGQNVIPLEVVDADAKLLG